MIEQLEVYDASFGDDILVGTLYPSLRRGALSSTFTYAPSYLANPKAYELEPALPLRSSPYHCKGLPGALRDSLPDRWGRHLIEREHRLLNDSSGPTRTLDDIDFLTGVFDLTREGSLRIKQPNGVFLSPSDSIPPSINLPKLMAAAREAAQDTAGLQQIKELLAAGSGSLGGARPKASVQEGQRLLLAKFSHPGDQWDVIAWEKVALDLANKAGISVPASQLVRIGDESALLLERFDRTASLLHGQRIPYISGMTLLSSEEGKSRDYAELAEALADFTKSPAKQLEQLFRRVVFSIAINNTDDHLRNWGFLRIRDSWQLSPLFDVNPNPDQDSKRVTFVAGFVGPNSSAGLSELAHYCELNREAAALTIDEVTNAVADWKHVAHLNGISDSEISLFNTVFSSGLKELSALI